MTSIPEIDEQAWIDAISAAIKSGRTPKEDWENGLDELEKVMLAKALAGGLPKMRVWTTLFANTAEFKAAKKKLEKFILLSAEINELISKSPPLEESAYFATREVLEHQHKGYPIDFAKAHDYARRVWLYLDDLHAMTTKAGKNNLPELFLCEMICNLFEEILGRKPTFSAYDLSNDSDDPMDGTDYERVCRTVSDLLNLDIAWTTMKQAVNSYKSDKPLARMEEHVGKHSIINVLPFEK